jgi:hypothetical protein
MTENAIAELKELQLVANSDGNIILLECQGDCDDDSDVSITLPCEDAAP